MYNYETEKPNLFTDDGQRMFLAIRDNVKAILPKAGCVRMDKATDVGIGGESWTMLACVDRMVELRELREIPQPNIAGQHRIFIAYNA